MTGEEDGDSYKTPEQELEDRINALPAGYCRAESGGYKRKSRGRR